MRIAMRRSASCPSASALAAAAQLRTMWSARRLRLAVLLRRAGLMRGRSRARAAIGPVRPEDHPLARLDDGLRDRRLRRPDHAGLAMDVSTALPAVVVPD